MKKCISLLLAIALIIGVLPMSVFAADTEATTISFSTTFEENMTVGDTFTVTASLANNPGMISMVLTLGWNEKTVNFTGFDKYDDNFPVSTVFEARGWTAEANHEQGIITAARTGNNSTNGTLFTANFEIIGSGDLNIVLKNDSAVTEFEMKNETGEAIPVTFDYSAIANLSVARPAGAGAEIPEGAPFTAITTDNGAVIEFDPVEFVDYSGYSTYENVPYYHVVIPEGATQVYVTHPASADPFCDSSYGSAYGYFADTTSWTGGGMNFEFETAEGGYKITLPLGGTFWAYDESFNSVEIEASFVASNGDKPTHAVAVEKTNTYSNAPICFFTFEYGTAPEGGGNNQGGGEEETKYDITVDQPTGGTITVTDENGTAITKAAEGDAVLLTNTPATGYQFVHYLINEKAVTADELGMFNGFYTMPASDVTISAVFELIPPTTYDITVNVAEHGSVVADKETAAAGATVTLTVTPDDGYELDTLTVKQGETPVEVTNNTFTMPAGAVSVTATFKALSTGYTYATSADSVVGSESNEVAVSVKVGNTDTSITGFNAYDITLSYDTDMLAVKKDENNNYDVTLPDGDTGDVVVDEEAGTIRIAGVGDEKDFTTAMATIKFTILKNGATTVAVDEESARISNRSESVSSDAPLASAQGGTDDTPATTVITKNFSVNLSAGITGETDVAPGAAYEFSYDTKGYENLSVKDAAGNDVTYKTTETGFVVESVQCDLVISVDAKTYSVTFTADPVDLSSHVTFNGEAQATYGESYEFTVAANGDYQIGGVTYKIGEETETATLTDGKYVIPAEDITGDIAITASVSAVSVEKTFIKFENITAAEIEGGQLTVEVTSGTAYEFTLIPAQYYTYTAKIGDAVLEKVGNKYTIPAELVTGSEVVVTITKTLDEQQITVEVNQYFNTQDSGTMWLITAKETVGEKATVLKYGENTMFWSSQYNAYCWLVLSSETEDTVKAAAVGAISVAAANTVVTEVSYNGDINKTSGNVDINDAQLAHDMYNARYTSFDEETGGVAMLKLLEADMAQGEDSAKKLNTQDAMAIINIILTQASDTTSTETE